MSQLRIPDRLPEDIEAERSLLATCCAAGMEARAAEVFTRLEERDFVVPRHRALFLAARALVFRGDELNAIALKAELESRRALDAVGGFNGLVDLLGAPEVGRPEILADLLARKRMGRELVKIGAQMVREAAEQVEDPATIARACARMALEASERSSASHRGPKQVGSILGAFLRNREDGVDPGIRCGIQRLDDLTGGLHPGNLVIVAARPALGKTALTLGWARHAAESQVRTGYWCLEMSREELTDRLTAQAGYFSTGWTRKAHLSREELSSAEQAKTYLESISLDICDEAFVSPAMIRASLAKAHTQGRPYGIVVADYLQLMADDDAQKASRQTDASRIGAISRSMKLIAKEFRIPVILLSQLNRDVEQGNGRKPRLSDLRDSGAIEQDADTVIFIHRKTVDGKPEELGDLVLAKNRHGGLGSIPIHFNGASQSFREVDRQTEPTFLSAACGREIYG